MPRFHFHIRDSVSLVGDGEGLVVFDEDAAILEAERFVRELVAIDVRLDGVVRLDQTIEVAYPDGSLLKRVEFSDIIQIVGR